MIAAVRGVIFKRETSVRVHPDDQRRAGDTLSDLYEALGLESDVNCTRTCKYRAMTRRSLMKKLRLLAQQLGGSCATRTRKPSLSSRKGVESAKKTEANHTTPKREDKEI